MEILPRARRTDRERDHAMRTIPERFRHVRNCLKDVVPDNVLFGVNVGRYAVFVERKGRNSAGGGRGRGRGQKNEHTWQNNVDSTGLKLDTDIYWTRGIMDAARKFYNRRKKMTPISMEWYGKVHMPLSDTVIRPTTQYSADTPHIVSSRVPPTVIRGLHCFHCRRTPHRTWQHTSRSTRLHRNHIAFPNLYIVCSLTKRRIYK